MGGHDGYNGCSSLAVNTSPISTDQFEICARSWKILIRIDDFKYSLSDWQAMKVNQVHYHNVTQDW